MRSSIKMSRNSAPFLVLILMQPKIFDVEYIFQEADLMGRVITDTEGREAFELWLRSFLPQLFDENFVLEPGELCAKLPLDRRLPHHKS